MADPTSRRNLVAGSLLGLAGAVVATTTSAAPGAGDRTAKTEATIRSWFKLWGDSRTWEPFDALMAEDFAFSSPNGDDHISKAVFKTRCWEPNIGLTQALEIEVLIAKADQAFIKYLGRTTGGQTFRNVELHRVRDGRIASIECFFGANMSFPAGVESPKKG